MESSYLRTLVEVVRSGSFSKTAQTLNLTQSAVSRRIKFLEEQYGTLLIDRSGPVLNATPAGRLVSEKAQLMAELEQELARDLEKLKQSTPLALACTRPFEISFLPAVMRKFHHGAPGCVDLELSFETPTQAFAGLREHRHDIIVVEHWHQFDFTPYRTVELGEDAMIFVSAPELGLSSPYVGIDDLVGHRLFRRRESCCSARLLAENMAAAGRHADEFRSVMLYDDLHVIVKLVQAGEGIALISRSLVEQQLENGTLRAHQVKGFRHYRSRTLAWQEDAQRKSTLRHFVNCVCDLFGVSASERSH